MLTLLDSIKRTPGSLDSAGVEGPRPTERKLALRIDVVRTMSESGISAEPQGLIRRPITVSCPQPTEYGSCRCPAEDQ